MDEKSQNQMLEKVDKPEGLLPVPAIKAQLNALHELMSSILQEGVDYGTIPGVKKPSLWKPGAEKICTMFRLDPQYEVLMRVIEEDFILYDVKCTLYSITSGQRLGSGVGSANSREENYHWRKAISESEYESTPLDRRREKEKRARGSGTYIEKQVRTSPYDFLNTIEKMAAKRAKIAATLDVTNASAIFTQDVEDMPKETFTDSKQETTREATREEGPPTVPDDGTITDPMVRLIHVLCGKLGVKGDKERHEYATILLVRTPENQVKSFKDLSFATGKWLINTMQALVSEKEDDSAAVE